MSYTKERNLLIKDFRYNGLIEQDVYDVCKSFFSMIHYNT